ncbi:Alpha/beta hydrolase fold-1 [Arabidopsis suecica]|uniref:Alpha/beta hydrolase fold-1 n=1 Tax=Arabidopsis suecica TaxID=45249 RepID=A0A8T2BXX4_ARASU|nr:Alpha/beta hydrolase fold-1 [Arabidopsis suecica]
MTGFFSLSQAIERTYKSGFKRSGLRPVTIDLKDGTVVNFWVSKTQPESKPKPNLLLIHGLGATAIWQWYDVARRLSRHFNLYIPDLVFFGGSSTTRPERSDIFQAQTLMRALEAQSVKKFSLVGLSYGGFVGYRMAAMYADAVERVVICCAAVCVEEKDMKAGVFKVSDLDEASKILVPESVKKLRELMGYIFYKPALARLVPTCLLHDFIEHALTRDNMEEKRELIKAIPKDRIISEIPKLTQPTLIIWGEHDQVFPLEMGKRLEKHLGDNGRLVIIKRTGHIFNFERPKTFLKHLKSFLLETNPQQNPISNGSV